VRRAVCLLLLAGFVFIAVVQAADPAPPGKDDWKYDIIYRKKNTPLSGLVIEDKPTHIKLLSITRKPGKPTVVMEDVVKRPEIDRVELLSDGDRAELEQRVKALRRDRELLVAQLKLLDPAAKDKRPIDMVNVEHAEWPADPKVKALQYQSTHFILVSNAKEEVVQLAAIQLEQVYAAYARALPPRVAKIEPTTILLAGSVDDYQALARDRGANLVNPAFYDDAKNHVVCRSDLQRLSAELERLYRHHDTLYTELNDREKELGKVYKGNIPNEILQPIKEARDVIRNTEINNNKAFRGAQERLFQRLYHEAFHAYLATAVYPRSEDEVPRWLNEGLAQIFETAIFEAGELRVGHADKVRLAAVREVLKKNDLPLADLLRSGPKQFQVEHASEKQISDKHYLTSWALAYYLTFGRKVLGTKALDDYVQALQRGTDPLDAFQTLVGSPLPQFEKDFQEYIDRLQPDGTVRGK
jgi:hypothetical protein